MFCYRCSGPATHVTKKGLYVCTQNAAKCPACSTKGKPQKKKIPPVPYEGPRVCDYGCHTVAKFIFNNGKYCCNSNSANCSFIRIVAGKKISQSKFKEVAPGLTLGQLASIKAAETKAADIDDAGNNAHTRSAKKVSEVKKAKIDPETGLNVHKLTAQKYQKWLDSEDGRNWKNSRAEQTRHDMARVVDPLTCETEAQRRSKIMVQTKISKINELGLNGFESAHWKSSPKNCGFLDGIFWQYSNERRFLERAQALGVLHTISRGPSLPYEYQGQSKTFFADFVMGNTIFEIKSGYTLYGPNNKFLQKNIAKLFGAQRAGYEVYLVVDDETMLFKDFLGTISNLLE